jgi:hypothetical protein
MPFDPNKDAVLKEWRCEDTGLIVSIRSYNKGEAKVQIGPRMVPKKSGGESMLKAGRLTIEDVMWFESIMPEVKGILLKESDFE